MSSRADVITVVEDDVAMARAVERLLRAKGFNVEIFYSAETFLASPSATMARCLVVDIQLGGMSGIDLCRDSCGARLTTRLHFHHRFRRSGGEESSKRGGRYRLSAKAVFI